MQPNPLRLDGIAHAYGPNRVLKGINLTLGAGKASKTFMSAATTRNPAWSPRNISSRNSLTAARSW
ncbi:hypothetical protein [Paracoccus versutus]|uniref:hypothetical protein n=1 Tax=Paracoccus versutus TaxID=34007 RepID=UPI00215D6CA2|nr:hypothetical protein [Paracoccus versutus]